MATNFLLYLTCLALLCALVSCGGHGGHHKKVVIHVPMHVKHHHHTHTIVKHVHHKHHGGGGGGDHYEVLGYTYGEPKAAPHGHGHGWGASDDDTSGYADSPTSFAGDYGGHDLSSAGEGWEDNGATSY